MKIQALQKVTLVDYPGRIAATVFTTGCNFSCCFCHNPELVVGGEKQQSDKITEKYFFDFLKERKNLVDGVCITGGEPTIQTGLLDFMLAIKKAGFLVKLDTNGSNPDVLQKIFDNGLVDYVAMDIKSSLENYLAITKVRSFFSDKCLTFVIQKSVDLIRNSGVDYEFRTTVVPKLITEKEVKKIGEWLCGAKAYYLQQFRKETALDKKWRKVNPYPDEKLLEMRKIVQPYFDEVGVRGL